MLKYEFDIAIIGAGPFSCFTALLLAKNGLKVALIFPENTTPLDSFLTSLNACWPSLNDPPTRAEVAHGHEMANYLHQFCRKGAIFFNENILKIIDDNANWIQSKCIRIGIKDFEIKELNDAYELGFGLKKTNKESIFNEENFAYLCLDKFNFKNKIINSLNQNNIKLISSSAIEINESQEKCTIKLENNSKVCCEIVILGNSLNISKLLPKFNSILIPMSDCLFEYQTNISYKKKFLPLSFRASNGHICGTIFKHKNNLEFRISGPRFLLPGAGAGINLTDNNVNSNILNNIEKYQREIIFDIIKDEINMPSSKDFNLIYKKINVDCYPCDELPIVGEYGKLGRILGSTGWLATGFSAGAWSAKIICDLILHEKSPELHPRLQPRRFFQFPQK